MKKLNRVFKTDYPMIGMVHLKALLGYKEFTSLEDIVVNGVYDATNLEAAGFDGILIENNYDLPHKIMVDKSVVASFAYVADKIKPQVEIPIGINVLWNDYKAGLSIAKTIGADFVRVPVFVDHVRTSYGDVKGRPDKVLEYRKKLSAENILLFTDIQVKHSELLNKRPIVDSAREAIEKGSDGLIVTGKWTGDAPDMKELEDIRSSVGEFPIIIGSGADSNNSIELLEYANGIIVGTSIKSGEKLSKKKNVNLKTQRERIDPDKAKRYIKKITEHIK